MQRATILLILLLALISLAGCGQTSFWAYGDDDALGLRAGREIADNVEVGVSTNYWPEEDNDTQLWGAYAIYHIPLDPVGAYVGAQTNLNNQYDEEIAPIVGFMFDEIFFTEYQYSNWENKASQEEDKIVFGVRIRF